MFEFGQAAPARTLGGSYRKLWAFQDGVDNLTLSFKGLHEQIVFTSGQIKLEINVKFLLRLPVLQATEAGINSGNMLPALLKDIDADTFHILNAIPAYNSAHCITDSKAGFLFIVSTNNSSP